MFSGCSQAHPFAPEINANQRQSQSSFFLFSSFLTDEREIIRTRVSEYRKIDLGFVLFRVGLYVVLNLVPEVWCRAHIELFHRQTLHRDLHIHAPFKKKSHDLPNPPLIAYDTANSTTLFLPEIKRARRLVCYLTLCHRSEGRKQGMS
jgi:hypothetical protein